jgi:hypothetical protein
MTTMSMSRRTSQNPFIIMAASLRVSADEGAGALRLGSFLWEGRRAPPLRSHGILGAPDQNGNQLASPQGAQQCIPGGHSARDRETPLECGAPS